MLIPSPRHTAADLELWAELEEADRANATRLGLSAKVEQSVQAIREFIRAGPCYVGVSGGKDSAVTVAILGAAGVLVDIPAVHFRAVPKANPDNALVFAALAERFPAMRLTVIEYESPVPLNDREGAEAVASANFKAACASAGDRRITGIRADESGVRKITLRHLGTNTPNSCRPLGWWTLADVYAYAASHRVPLHPVYGMLGGGRWNRKSLRVDALMGANGDQFGRGIWETEYYPDVVRRLTQGA